MKIVYLDWNVFNKMEKVGEQSSPLKEQLSELEVLIQDKRIAAVYSNAHISDLVRGYLKNPGYIPDHLNTLRRLTNNLCITQYWGESKTRWHFRDPQEYFDSALEDRDSTALSFSTLFEGLDDPLMRAYGEIQNISLKLKKIDPGFRKIYTSNKIG
ncbi:hypothetical protein EGT74_16710 [Chitinophaga lutea]|uniref:PIN domain-containing protein n=1 Tax=Chitinophaga lutea TaxID=2488634 RepID=A0A3N4PM78_9BACT|nr:hypothetical protein [Chitinophaga lutea]RPE08678.1 hypothetical protein EGT74_16710 [Chitinophaga lutea]